MMNTKKLTINGMLAAMCAVLGYISIDMGNIKVTFESLPVLLGAFLFGPLDGVIVGAVGSLISQLLKYGVSLTTGLWMLPCIVCGFMVGSHAKNNNFRLSRKKMTTIIVTNELLFMLLNTIALYVDSKVYGYFSPAYIYGALGIRVIIAIGKAVAYSLILPPIISAVRKNIKD